MKTILKQSKTWRKVKKKKKIKKDKFEFEIADKFSDDDLFDDCPICQAMKAAHKKGVEMAEDELKEAFKKSKEGGGMVGGEWFDEKK